MKLRLDIMLASLKRLYAYPMRIEVLSDTYCQVYGINYRSLYHCLSQLPGAVFPRKPHYLWTGCGIYADFIFRGHTFQIESDPWDGALSISAKDKLAHPEAIREIQEHLERFVSKER